MQENGKGCGGSRGESVYRKITCDAEVHEVKALS